ncbi:MAG: hypothetical protein QOH34_1551 [Mycobacterium sp.]|nr:hypothetical protein [Mycobacterium sp.]
MTPSATYVARSWPIRTERVRGTLCQRDVATVVASEIERVIPVPTLTIVGAHSQLASSDFCQQSAVM